MFEYEQGECPDESEDDNVDNNGNDNELVDNDGDNSGQVDEEDTDTGSQDNITESDSE